MPNPFNKFSDMKVGMKVRCLCSTLSGMTGTIKDIYPGARYIIEWDQDDDNKLNPVTFGFPGSFEPIEDVKICNGAKCIKCNSFNEYVDKEPYTCYSCRNNI